MLNKSRANYGWKIHDAGLGSSSSTTYRSSDYGSPYRPELVIDHTGSTTPSYYCGNRAYESKTGKTCNCMGYALDVDQYIKPGALNPRAKIMNDISTLNELLTVINGLSIIYMANRSMTFETLNAYNSSIKTDRYRVVLRVGYSESNQTEGMQLSPNPSGDYTHDAWDYHWWYQTNTGQWAEKGGQDPSMKIPGTSASTNPGSSANLGLWDYYYTSGCKYFAIKQDTSN